MDFPLTGSGFLTIAPRGGLGDPRLLGAVDEAATQILDEDGEHPLPGLLVQLQLLVQEAIGRRGLEDDHLHEEEFDEDGNSIPGFVTSVPRSSKLTASEKR